jgi:hypothetical protein
VRHFKPLRNRDALQFIRICQRRIRSPVTRNSGLEASLANKADRTRRNVLPSAERTCKQFHGSSDLLFQRPLAFAELTPNSGPAGRGHIEEDNGVPAYIKSLQHETALLVPDHPLRLLQEIAIAE